MNERERDALAHDMATLEVRSMILEAIIGRLRTIHDIFNQYFINYRVFEETGICPICESHEPISREELERQLIETNKAYDTIITHRGDIVQTIRLGQRTLKMELGLSTEKREW